MQRITLLDLPNEVLQLIVQSLMSDSLFTPRYKDSDFEYHGGLCDYTSKCEEYYGERTDEHEMRAQGLLNWSACSKHFRTFLAPFLFETVVLRDSSRSISSVTCLMKTVHWNNVRCFIFATSLESSRPKVSDSDSDSDVGHDEDGNEVFDTTEDLGVILSQLPPNLRSLTLDLPEGGEDVDFSIGEPFPLDNDTETTPYRIRLRKILTWVSTNNISTKDTFELRLNNVPPYHSLAYDTASWKSFLSGVSVFVLGLQHYENGAGWEMNTHVLSQDFASMLGSYFWDHLESLQSFSLQGDSSWPLGAPDDLRFPLELQLPSSRSFQELRHVSFRETFVCTQMLVFLQAHASTIETIELVDCFAPDLAVSDGATASEDDDNDRESWATFFRGLFNSHPKALKDFVVSHVARTEDRLLDCYKPSAEEAQRRRQVREELRSQEESFETSSNGDKLLLGRKRTKKLLAYCSVDDKYGMIFEGSGTNADRFLAGIDHQQWLRLVDFIEENAKKGSSVLMPC